MEIYYMGAETQAGHKAVVSTVWPRPTAHTSLTGGGARTKGFIPFSFIRMDGKHHTIIKGKGGAWGDETAEHSYCNVVNMLSSDVTNTFAEVVDMIKQ